MKLVTILSILFFFFVIESEGQPKDCNIVHCRMYCYKYGGKIGVCIRKDLRMYCKCVEKKDSIDKTSYDDTKYKSSFYNFDSDSPILNNYPSSMKRYYDRGHDYPRWDYKYPSYNPYNDFADYILNNYQSRSNDYRRGDYGYPRLGYYGYPRKRYYYND
uniref:INVERT_DEFENSINS domain-containing protein n=2 Tax=Parastrongyloides trichosuri TaxID=131310 RepID=A0A0N5A661_PARTI